MLDSVPALSCPHGEDEFSSVERPMLRQHQPVKSGPKAARGRVSQMSLLLVPLFLAFMHPHGPASPSLVLVSAPSFLPSQRASKGSYVATRRAKTRNPEVQGSAYWPSHLFSSCNFGDEYCFFLCKYGIDVLSQGCFLVRD